MLEKVIDRLEMLGIDYQKQYANNETVLKSHVDGLDDKFFDKLIHVRFFCKISMKRSGTGITIFFTPKKSL